MSGDEYCASHLTCYVLCAVCCVLLLAACGFPGNVKPTVKIGLSAPFEGRYRDLGYEALHAVRLAVRQWNEIGGVGDRYLVELVALNDFNEPETAIVQARKMAVDPGVLAVLGGWSPEVTHATVPEYERLDLVFLSPEIDWTQDESQSQASVDPAFAAGYKALSGGGLPGQAAIWAYGEANRLLGALDAATCAESQPTRENVRTFLSIGQQP